MIEHGKKMYEDFRKSNPNLNLTDEEISLILSTRELSEADYESVMHHIREIVIEKDRQKG